MKCFPSRVAREEAREEENLPWIAPLADADLMAVLNALNIVARSFVVSVVVRGGDENER